MDFVLIRKGRYETLVIGMTVRHLESTIAKGYIIPDTKGFFLDATAMFLNQLSRLSLFDWKMSGCDQFVQSAIERAKAYIAGNFWAEDLNPVLTKIGNFAGCDVDETKKLIACFEETLRWIRKSDIGIQIPSNALAIVIIVKFFLEHFTMYEHRASSMKIFGSLPGT